jgi:hypothetical protein
MSDTAVLVVADLVCRARRSDDVDLDGDGED